MKGLLIKDLRLILQRKMFFALMLVCTAFLGMTDSGPSFIIYYFTIIGAMFTSSTISYDEYDNCFPFLFTLPTTRKQYASEKFLFGFLATLCSDIFSTLAAVIITLVKGTPITKDIFIASLVIIPISMIMNSVSLPVMLKLGLEKGRIGLYIVLVPVIVVVTAVMKNDALNGKFNEMLSYADAHEILTGVILGAAAIAIIVISYIICTDIMKKKEL